jgi:hypothetical protein
MEGVDSTVIVVAVVDGGFVVCGMEVGVGVDIGV